MNQLIIIAKQKQRKNAIAPHTSGKDTLSQVYGIESYTQTVRFDKIS
jgi:hypothetical protein